MKHIICGGEQLLRPTKVPKAVTDCAQDHTIMPMFYDSDIVTHDFAYTFVFLILVRFGDLNIPG